MNSRGHKIIEHRCFPETLELLIKGGDSRILTVAGLNEYGCGPCPDPGLISFGSSTASTISASGFAAADSLRKKIIEDLDTSAYDREFNRIRKEFIALCGLTNLDRLEILFAASGTDAHLVASRLIAPEGIIMAERSETGRGVPAALEGRHFSTRSAYAERLTQGEALNGCGLSPVSEVRIRNADGTPRDAAEVDAEIYRQVRDTAGKGNKVLLVLVDVSKTGMIAPSPACAMELKAEFPELVEVLVDACQFRMASATLRAYLEKGFMVALTGSKFLTGPAFSGALLIPGTVQRQKTPGSLSDYASRFEWPGKMRFGFSGSGINAGLLLRWEAALAEFRAFRDIPDAQVQKFLTQFEHAIRLRLGTDPNFEELPVPAIDRRALTEKHCWDQAQTIFPFRIKKNGQRLDPKETSRIHTLLQQDLSPLCSLPLAGLRCSLGQPVSCGEGDCALRLCASARLAVEGCRHAEDVIERANAVLDKAVMLLHTF